MIRALFRAWIGCVTAFAGAITIVAAGRALGVDPEIRGALAMMAAVLASFCAVGAYDKRRAR